jgi:hypothetical protein
MSILTALHEATSLLAAAERYASVLSEGGITEHELHQLRVIVVKVAAHSYIYAGNGQSIAKELDELQALKKSIVRTIADKFGDDSSVLREFCAAA